MGATKRCYFSKIYCNLITLVFFVSSALSVNLWLYAPPSPPVILDLSLLSCI